MSSTSITRPIPIALAIGALLIASAVVLGRAEPLPGPTPELEADAAVRLQLDALARNDEPFPDAGITVTWSFASPDNRTATGPLTRFRTLFENPIYGPMVDHVAARISEARRLGEQALVGVVLTTPGGEERGYLFQLSRHDAEHCAGCWMTDSVRPMPVPRQDPPLTL